MTQIEAYEFVSQMVKNKARLSVDLGADIGEEPYEVTVTGLVKSDCGIEEFDVEIMGEFQAGTVGLMELVNYLDDGCVRIMGIS